MSPARTAGTTGSAGAAFLATLALTACGQPAAPAPAPAPVSGQPAGYRRPYQDDATTLPGWVHDPSVRGSVIGAFGSALRRPGQSLSEQRDAAAQAGRAELARMVSVRVQTALRTYLSEGGAGNSGVVGFADQVSRSVASQQVEGSVVREQWIHPSSGELYVWIIADKALAAKLAAQVRAAAVAVPPSSPQEAHLRAKVDSDAAFAELDKLISKP